YVGNTRIPKYWEYPRGIYFKVLDEAFLVDHEGEPIRFSRNDQDFENTGVNLPGPRTRAATTAATHGLPLQADVLNERALARPARGGAARKRSTRATRHPVRKRKSRKSR